MVYCDVNQCAAARQHFQICVCWWRPARVCGSKLQTSRRSEAHH